MLRLLTCEVVQRCACPAPPPPYDELIRTLTTETIVVAKEMLRTGRSPRDTSERMIVNNYHAMEFLRSNHGEKLTRQSASGRTHLQ